MPGHPPTPKVLSQFAWLRFHRPHLLLAAALLLLAAVPLLSWEPALLLAAPGDLDPSFGTGGKVTTDFGGSFVGKTNEARALLLQPDGKIVTAGFVTLNYRDFALARYNPNGTLDKGFGAGGWLNVAVTGDHDEARALALQPDGKIIAAGYAWTVYQDFALVRFNPNGSRDSSFGSNGKVITDLGGNPDEANAVAVQPDGKIVAAGWTSSGPGWDNFALVRYNPDGSLDPSFGSGGKVTVDFKGGNDRAYALALQPDGKLLAAGYATLSGLPGTRDPSDIALAVVRFNSDGALDSGFGTGGTATAHVAGSAYQQGRALALQPDGRIVVGGKVSLNSAWQYGLVRFNSDGTLDPGFGTGGAVVTSAGTDGISGVVLQPDGKIIAAGSSPDNILNSNGPTFGGSAALLRYNPDGSLDRSFGVDGRMTNSSGGVAAAVALQPDGKIVTAGYANQDFAVARYMSTGPDVVSSATHGPAGMAVTLNGNSFVPNEQVAISWDGSGNGSNCDPAGVRLTTVTADAGGLIQVPLTIPACAVPGSHTIIAQGSQRDTLAFTVEPDKLAVSVDTTYPLRPGNSVLQVKVQSQGAGGAPGKVTQNTAVQLSVKTGAGALSSATTATIPAGSDSVMIYPIYSQAEAGVVLQASAVSGDALAAGVTVPLTIENYVPYISGLSPNTVPAGQGAFTLTVAGAAFIPASTVRWNGQDRPTAYLNRSVLSAAISAEDVAGAGAATVSVLTPGPGGGVSSALSFRIGASGDTFWGQNTTALTAATTGYASAAPSTIVASGLAGAVDKVTVTLSRISLANTARLGFLLVGPRGQTVVLPPVLGNVNNFPGQEQTIVLDSSAVLPASSGTFPAPAPTGPYGQQLSALRATEPNGNWNLYVYNSGYGSGQVAGGWGLTVTTQAAQTITALSPASTMMGGPAFTLTVSGANFAAGSTVQWNGQDRPTAYVSSNELHAAIPAEDIAAVTTALVAVHSPDGMTSRYAGFPVLTNPAPALQSLGQGSNIVGQPLTLAVYGSGFMPSSVVRWNGQDQPTTYQFSRQLLAQIPGSAFTAPGTGHISVFTPAPGGGLSSELPLTVFQATPDVTALAPPSALQGSAGLALHVRGSNFVPSSVVRWNGHDRPTAFVSATELTIDLTAADLAAAGSQYVAVITPDAQASDGMYFNVTTNPAPSISTLTPSSITAGGPAFTLMVAGYGFVPASVVTWNNAPRPTAFISSNELQVSITAADIAEESYSYIQATTPAPGGGSSPTRLFGISLPPLGINSLSPAGATAGGPAFTLTINGAGFRRGVQMRWNDSPRPTRFVSAAQLEADITAEDIAQEKTARLTAANPLTSGGVEYFTVPFEVKRHQTALALAFDSPATAYSDLAQYRATLLDQTSGNAPVAGAAVTVTINGAAQASTTDANGVATGTYRVLTAAGAYPAQASYAGNALLQPVSGSAALTVTGETATALYTGVSVARAGDGPLPVSAAVTEVNDGRYGSQLGSVQLQFAAFSTLAAALDPAAAPSQSVIAMVSGGPSGTAAGSLALPAGNWYLALRQADHAGYYTLTAGYPALVSVLTPQGTVTRGSGTVAAAPAQAPAALILTNGSTVTVSSQSAASVQLSAGTAGAGFGGLTHEYQLNGGAYRVRIASLSRSGTGIGCPAAGSCAQARTVLTGEARLSVLDAAGVEVGGGRSYHYELTAVAGGAGGASGYALTVTDAQGQLVYQLGTAASPAPLATGSVTTP